LLTRQGIHVRLVAAMTAALPTFALPAAAQDRSSCTSSSSPTTSTSSAAQNVDMVI